MTSLVDTKKKFYYLVSLDTLIDDAMYVLFLNVKERRGARSLTTNLLDRFIASRALVMTQWLAHPTSNQGDGGSIPTNGCYFFFIQKKEQLVVPCRYFYVHSQKSV